MLGNFSCFPLLPVDFFAKLTVSKSSFSPLSKFQMAWIQISCLQRLSADKASKERFNYAININHIWSAGTQ